MKKSTILLSAAFALLLCSCGNKAAKLESQTDSLNYAIGYMNGTQIGEEVLSNMDDEEKAQKELIKAIEKAYNEAKETDDEDMSKQAYKMGEQIGQSLQKMEEDGLLGNKDWEVNKELIAQGLVNALMKHEGGMTTEEAQQYVQQVMMQAQAQQK